MNIVLAGETPARAVEKQGADDLLHRRVSCIGDVEIMYE